MLSASLSFFWPVTTRDLAAPETPRKRPPPIFIGDAVQPWGSDTMLLALLRAEAAEEDGNDA